MEKLISAATEDLDAVADRLIAAALATDETDNQTLILWRSHPAL
jgi:serine/threonine protein phosphatase PrpC